MKKPHAARSSSDAPPTKRSKTTETIGQRLMLGVEALKLQAFPIELLSHLHETDRPSDSMCADLAGNGFTGTVVLAALLGIMLEADVVKEDSMNAPVNINDVLSLMD